MRIRRWRTVLSSILSITLLTCAVSCSPLANDSLVTGSPPSEDEEFTLEPVGYFYKNGTLQFVIPECFGPIINVTVTDTYSMGFTNSWRAGNPDRVLHSSVRADGHDFQVIYGDESVIAGNISVVITTARRLDVLMELPTLTERKIPKHGNAIMQDGMKVATESIANNNDPCSKVIFTSLK